MGERMVRVEEEVKGLRRSVEQQHDVLGRLHQRMDEFDTKLTDAMSSFHSRLSDTIQDVEHSLDAHVKEEEKLADARLESIREGIRRVEEAGAERLAAQVAAVSIQAEATRELKKLIIRLTFGGFSLLAAIATGIGWGLSFLFDHAAALSHILRLMETFK